jgi:hypothetical protein
MQGKRKFFLQNIYGAPQSLDFQRNFANILWFRRNFPGKKVIRGRVLRWKNSDP